MQRYSVYVYYKVEQSKMADAVQESLALGKAIEVEFDDVRFSLSRRPEIKEGHVTLMERFELGEIKPVAVEHFMLELNNLSSGPYFEYLPVQRHTEVFYDIVAS